MPLIASFHSAGLPATSQGSGARCNPVNIRIEFIFILSLQRLRKVFDQVVNIFKTNR